MPEKKRLMDLLYNVRFLIFLLGLFIINLSIWADLINKRGQTIGFGTIQIIALGVGILVLIAGIYLQFPNLVFGIFKILSVILFSVGVGLSSINIIGLLIPLRDPEINSKEFSAYEKSKRVNYNKVAILNNLDRRKNEHNEEYAHRLVDLVYDSTLHFFEPSNPGKYHQRVPIYENYILFFKSFLPNVSDHYEFCNPYKALERGVGICSQFSKITSAILEQNGIPANIYVLSGHVVTEVLIDENLDQWWVLDADYGVVIEHGIETLETNPELVREAYIQNGYSNEKSIELADIYGSDGNYIQTNKGYCKDEVQSYINKWLWPILSMIPFGSFLLWKTIDKTRKR